MSQLGAAAALGVSDRRWWGWEHGEQKVPIAYRLAMAALALGLTDYEG